MSGALGGIPGYHALSLTALAERMRVDARAAGLIAALVPLAAVVFGASVVGLIPRMIVGGVLVFLGLAFIVEWVWDKRRLLPPLEYAVVLVILVGIIVWGFLVGVVIGLVLAVVLFAISYGRIELVREVAFGETYRSNVDRPASERAELRGLSDRVQILRVSRVRLLRIDEPPAGAGPPPGGTGGHAAAVPGDRSAPCHGRGLLGGRRVREGDAPGGGRRIGDRLHRRLRSGACPARPREAWTRRRGSWPSSPTWTEGCSGARTRCSSAPSLDEARREHPAAASPDGLPPGLAAHLERVSLPDGTVLLHQDDPPGDVYVLESGRLGVETVTPEGTRLRLRTLRPGVVVGEITLYTDVPRTADVVAEVPSVVLRIGRGSIERLEAEEPELAAALHRWLATTMALRLTDRIRALDALLD